MKPHLKQEFTPRLKEHLKDDVHAILFLMEAIGSGDLDYMKSAVSLIEDISSEQFYNKKIK